MPRLSANISLLFTEHELPDRFAAAARAGFAAVEIQFPYDYPAALLRTRARDAGVQVVLCNLPAGDLSAGDRGIGCLPGRVDEFREGVARAITYARALDCPRLNCLAGVAGAGADAAALRETLIRNLRYAAAQLQGDGIELLAEPVNTRTFPGSFLRHTAQALALFDEVRASNLRLQYDVFHMQIMEGDIARTLEAHIRRIGHIQIADVPRRHEPGTGELNFEFLLGWIDRLGYEGWIGAEYVPAAGTEAGLDWARRYLKPF
jgi:hydroxypyruvate isomerase